MSPLTLRATEPTPAPRGFRDLYLGGLYLQALAAARALGPTPDTWKKAVDPEGGVYASYLLAQLGAPQQAAYTLLRTWRSHRRHPEVAAAYVSHVLSTRGPVAAWELTDRLGELESQEGAAAAHWHVVRAQVLAQLRDFSGAGRLLERARAGGLDDPWAEVVAADVLGLDDRRQEALEHLQAAFAGRSPFRAAAQHEALLLQALDRPADALACLVRADATFESAAIALQRAVLETELEDYDAAERSLRRSVELAPLIEVGVFLGSCVRLGQVCYLAGRIDEAIRLLRVVPSPTIAAFVARLEAEPACRRRRIAVPLVRQHHMTCAPATLTAIATAWGVAADHLEIAEAICYDGTPARSERRWAERSGFTTREFSVTWESAVALLDRGVPFTLAQVETGSAHLVAVMGHDPLRETLLLRDPAVPEAREVDARAFLAHYRASGPRGMAVVPEAERSRLDGLELPDASLYDRLHALELALEVHARDGAAAELAALEAAAPGHRLTLIAGFVLAAYDGDETRALLAVQGLRALHPGDLQRALQENAFLKQQGRHAERRALLEALVPERPHPLVRLALAELLLDDSAERDRARWQLHLAGRGGPGDGAGLSLDARLHWLDGRREAAADRFRLAACLVPTDEARAAACYAALLEVRGPDHALGYLRQRVEHLGDRAPGPAIALASALEALGRGPEAVDVLDEAMRRRPEDGVLALEAARQCARLSRGERARALLEAARDKAPRGRFWRVAAEVACVPGGTLAEATIWRDLLDAEPLALDAHEALADLLARAEGAEAAVAHLRGACERFPHHIGLRRLLARRLVSVDRGAAIEELRTCLRQQGEDGWTRRELALYLADEGRHDEARAAIEQALAREPESVAVHMVLGWVARRAGRRAEAIRAYRRALTLAPGFAEALIELCSLADSPAEQHEVVATMRGLSGESGPPGVALLAFVEGGGWQWDAAAVRGLVATATQQRPDDADVVSAAVALALATGAKDEARVAAERGVTRWPQRARSWIDVARARAACGDAAGERAALERVLALDPGDAQAALALAAALQTAGDAASARRLVERVVERYPGHGPACRSLARLLFDAGERVAAFERLLALLELEPGDPRSWALASHVAGALDRTPELVATARRIATRPSSPNAATLALVRLLVGEPGAAAERLERLDAAIARTPLDVVLHDERICELERVGRSDEAVAACEPRAWKGGVPVPILGRAAWLRARRGDVTGAMDEMVRVLDGAPWYAWGFAQLTAWCEQTRRWRVMLGIGEKVVTAQGGSAEVCLTMARAHAGAGDRSGQEAWLRRALVDSPEHLDARQLLMDIELDRDHLDQAAALLHPGDERNPFFAAREVRLRLQQLDTPAALVAYERTCAETRDETWPLRFAGEQLARHGRAKDGLRILWKRVERLPVPSVVVRQEWARQAGLRAPGPLLFHRVARLRHLGEAGVHAIATCLEKKALGRWALLFVLCFARFLRRSASTWSAVGNVLLGRQLPRLARWWLRDWRARDVQPYMLCNVAAACRARGRVDEAIAASQRALTLPADHTSNRHRLWLALDALVARDYGRARALVGQCGAIEENSYDAFLEALCALIARVDVPAGAQRRPAVRLARCELDQLERRTPTAYRSRWVARAAARALRDADPGLEGWWWWLSRKR